MYKALGNTDIRWSALGSNYRREYHGEQLVGAGLPTYPMLEPRGHWRRWEDKPEYAPALEAPVFNILDYGADPTGEKNCLQAVRAALADLKIAGGGTIYAPRGLYTVWCVTEDISGLAIAFPLHTSNTVFEGDGPDKTVFNFRAMNGQDPQALILARGNGFGTTGAPAPVDGITLRGFRASGNAAPTNTAGVWGSNGHTTGWDIHHKGLVCLGGQTVTNVVIEDCEWDNWRGEILYSGGGHELGNFTVRRCIVRGSNASVISMGGYVTVEDCDIYAFYNGTECRCMGGQSLTVLRNRIRPQFGLPSGVNIGEYGVVFLGDAAASLTVEDNEIGASINGGVFMSEAASNVSIRRNTFVDTRGIYAIWLGQYTDFPDGETWENWIIEDNTLVARNKNVGRFILGYISTADNVLVKNNTLARENGHTITAFFELAGGARDLVITGNDIGDTIPIFPFNGIRPAVWEDNITTDQGPSYTTSDTSDASLEFGATWRKARVSTSGHVAKPAHIPANTLSRYPQGFIMEIRGGGTGGGGAGFHAKTVEINPDPAWNTLERGYALATIGNNVGSVLRLVMNNGKFDLLDYEYPPPWASPFTQTNPSNAQISPYGYGHDTIMFTGRQVVTLAPTVAHTYAKWLGVGLGDTVTIHCNGNVTLAHVPGEMELWNGEDFVSPGTTTLTATRGMDGVLRIFDWSVGTLVYKTTGGTDLELDVYTPSSGTDRTAVVFIHGGGWTSGTRGIHAAHCGHLASLGFVAVNVDYRLVAGDVDLFDQVADVRAAIRWVRENAATYGIDPDDIVIVGESAGGHLAGVAAFVDAFDDGGGDQGVSSRPDRAILINPITYLPGIPWYEGHDAQVGATPVPDDDTQLTPADTGADDSLRLSPMLYAGIAGQPDVLFIHGDEDSVVPYTQSSDFHGLLLAAENNSTLVTMEGSDHAFFLPGYGSEGEIAATLAAIEDFLG